jgi:hypothetical protein
MLPRQASHGMAVSSDVGDMQRKRNGCEARQAKAAYSEQ